MSNLPAILHLYLLGVLGWVLFKLIHFPVPALIGTIAIIGTLRATNVTLPMPPAYLYSLVQLLLGYYVGSKITKEITKHLKGMIVPVLIIIIWAISVLFILGAFLARVTFLDLYTAILSSSVAGFPEMTVIALATDADATVVVVAQAFRMIVTVVTFPLVFKYWIRKKNKELNFIGDDYERVIIKNYFSFIPINIIKNLSKLIKEITCNLNKFPHLMLSYLTDKPTHKLIQWGLLTLVIAVIGGSLFSLVGVPAGTMVGAAVFVATFSILGFNVKSPPQSFFGVIQVGLGLEVSKSISIETIELIFSGDLLIPLLVITLIIFLSSFLIAYIIHKTVDWDLPTCFLAAAPAGFSVMTALAIEYKINPLYVSVPHLFRLLSVKMLIPFVFMTFM